MIVKKPAVLLSSYNGLHGFCNSPQFCTSSHQPPGPETRTTQRHSYATIASDPSTPPSKDEVHIDLSWPSVKRGHKTPTPYQILNHDRGKSYTKKRFYELVKVYHPDRDHSCGPDHIRSHINSIPPNVRLERYRLIVAAHTILSDPLKRNAYDRYGAGWNGSPEAVSHDRTNPYQHGPHNPMQNATWEDWERFYRQSNAGDGKPQSPIFMSNSAFVATIMIFAALGGVGQATRASSFAEQLEDRRDRVHRETAAHFRKVREASRGMDREARIESFLRHRDSSTHADEAWRRMLPEPERCLSDEVSGKSSR